MSVLYITVMSSEFGRNIGKEGVPSIELVDKALLPENRTIRPRRSPKAEWRTQLQILTSSYASILGVAPEEYQRQLDETLKEDFLRKAESAEDISNLLIVETRIALPDMLKIAHIGTFLDPREIED